MNCQDGRMCMEALERRWFELNGAATAARSAVAANTPRAAGSPVLTGEQAKLDTAERQKHETMRQIEAIEDSLLEDTLD
jgi:hypothetical protein